MTSFTINHILEKTENRDKDFRYMATSDLLTELQKDYFKPDTDGERKICRSILKLLNDQSSDVQGLAVKCLSPLVRKVHDDLVDNIMVELCGQVLTGKEEQRDICSIGLKTVVLEMPHSMAQAAVRQLTPKLISGISKDGLEVKLECMDILNDLLKRFGSALKENESHSCLDALFNELGSARPAARKRAIACIASISMALPDKLLSTLVTSIVTKMDDKSVKGDLRRTYIQTLSAISRSGGYRLGKQLDSVVPLVLQQCNQTAAVSDPEMIESCLQAFESFVLRCPKEVNAYQSAIAKCSLEYLRFDPNYADDDEEMDDADDEEEDMDEDDADYSDDDDVSWKVRRAAAKVLSAIIVSRADKLSELFPEVAPVLVSRFREREENVKMDVFSTFNDVLQQVSASRTAVEAINSDSMVVDIDTSSPAHMLLAEVPRIVKAASRQLKEKSVKTRVAVFNCLRNLVSTLPGCLSDHAAILVPGIDKALKDPSNNLRIESLVFLQLALSSHQPVIFQPHIASLLPSIASLVNDRYYKITAEALRVCSEIVRVLRPDPPATTFDYTTHAPVLFNSAKTRLLAQDQDQEVKECAISCMGLVICHLGDACTVEVPAVLPILLERLRNEITRITAVKTFSALASAKLDLPLSIALSSPAPGGQVTLLPAVVAELCSFLRKSNRPLRQASLAALATIISSHSSMLSESEIGTVLDELPALVTDSDLHVAHLTLRLCTAVVHAAPKQVMPKIKSTIMPKVNLLLQSTLLQGYALRSLLDFFAELVRQDVPELSFSVLSAELLGLAGLGMSRHSLSALSQAIAVCCTHVGNASQRDSMVTKFMGQLSGADTAQLVLPLLCLGEIGRANDLSQHRKLLEKVMACFSSSLEEAKSAASFALGNVAAGNLSVYLPYLLNEMNGSLHEYLMLHALKEMIGSAPTQLTSYVDQILPRLFEFAERDEEGMRNIVAECLGKLSAVTADKVRRASSRNSRQMHACRCVS